MTTNLDEERAKERARHEKRKHDDLLYPGDLEQSAKEYAEKLTEQAGEEEDNDG